MKVVLKNFRVHEDISYVLPSDGVTVVTGASGRGKTTLFEAIEWCLFGGRKSNIGHLASSSRKTSVELTGGVLHRVYRSRLPGHLEVRVVAGGKLLRLDEAQAKLDEVFGPRDVFGACCYIRQKSAGTFLGLGPGDRRRILESIFFDESVSPMVQSTRESSGHLAQEARGERSSLERDTEREEARAEQLRGLLKNAPEAASEGADASALMKKLGACKSASLVLAREEGMSRQWHANTASLASAVSAIDEMGREGGTLNPSMATEHRRGMMKGRLDVLTGDRDSLEKKFLALDAAKREFTAGPASALSQPELGVAVRRAQRLHNSVSRENGLLSSLSGEHGLAPDLDEVEEARKAGEVVRVREAADRCVSAVAQRLSAFGRKYVRSDPGAHPSCYAQKCEGLRMKCRVNLKCPRCDVGLAYDRAAKSVTESDQGRGVGGAEYEGVNSDAVVLGELCGELSRNAALCGSLREVGVARRLLKLLASLGVVRRDIENQRAETKRCFSVEELDAETRRRKICAQAAQARVCLDKNSRERCSLEELMQHAERTYLLRKEQSLRNYFSSGVREPEAVKAAAAENDLEQGRLEDLVRELSLSSEVMAARTELESRLLNARKSREQCESLVQRETAALHIREAVKVATEQLIGEKLDSINTRMQAILESLFCGRAEQVPRCRLVSNRQKKSKAKRTAPRRGCVVASGSDADTKWEICLVSEHAGFTASGSLFFSGGEYDRVSLALALALAETTGARFLMLDETLGSVEEDTANRVIEVLDSWSKRCGGAPVYLIAHQLDGNGCEVLEM